VQVVSCTDEARGVAPSASIESEAGGHLYDGRRPRVWAVRGVRPSCARAGVRVRPGPAPRGARRYGRAGAESVLQGGDVEPAGLPCKADTTERPPLTAAS
jgi:hypothetical protein